MSGQHFYAIQGVEGAVKVFVAVNNSDNLRDVCDKGTLESLLGSMHGNVVDKEFESKKDRINFYKDEAKTNDVNKQYRVLKELYALADRGKSEDSALAKQIETLSLEIKYVFGISTEEAEVKIKDALAN